MWLTAQETEDLERPRERRRRNSDSCLYGKARDETFARREKRAETKHQESEKYELVERYLQNIQETSSTTTETTDSGIRTHGEPSDLEMQDISGKYNLSIANCNLILSVNLACVSFSVFLSRYGEEK